MTAKQEAAAAALEQGRLLSMYEVRDRPLVRNGRMLKPGTRVRLCQADADILLERGRVKRAGGKPAKPVEDAAGA